MTLANKDWLDEVRIQTPLCTHCGAVDFIPLSAEAKQAIRSRIEGAIGEDENWARGSLDRPHAISEKSSPSRNKEISKSGG